MRIFSRFGLFIILINFASVFAFSQIDTGKVSYGIYGAFNNNWHSSEFKSLPDCPSCSPGFQSGSGTGAKFGIVVDYPIKPQFYLSSKLFYSNLSGKLVRNEPTTLIQKGNLISGEFEHNIDADLKIIGFEPSIKYNCFKDLFISVGLSGGILSTKNYSQSEKITQPTNSATFLDSNGADTHLKERNKFSGTLKSANSVLLSAVLSVSYQLPLNKTKELFIVPEINFNFGLSNILNDPLVDKWKVNSLSLGAALKYSPNSKPELKYEFRRIENIDTISQFDPTITKSEFIKGRAKSDTVVTTENNIVLTQETIFRTDTVKLLKLYNLQAFVTAVGISKTGEEIKNPAVKIEEIISNRLDPLLNYMFFDENSALMAQRYVKLKSQEFKNFSIDSLYFSSTADIYHNLLNIIAKRMQGNPDSKITLVGCNSGVGAEQSNKELSLKRASTVKDYLVDIAGISGDRITIQTRNLPSKYSTPKDEPVKAAENQRVEIYSEEYELLEPIFIQKVDRLANPPTIRFKPTVIADAKIINWELKSYQASDASNYFHKSGASDIPTLIDWNLEESQKLTPKSPESIIYSLSVEDGKGQTKKIENQTLPLEVFYVKTKRINQVDDYEIEKFNLILFDFKSSTINSENAKIIEFISQRIKPESQVEIIGYSDNTGDPEYNLQLSQKRAKSVNSALKLKGVDIKIGNDLNKDETYPENRFYSRRVEIIVKTKIVKE